MLFNVRKTIIARIVLILALLGGLFGTVQPKQVLAAPGDLIRFSVASDSAQANENSASAAISGNGNSIVFHSAATNLVNGDTNGAADIFFRDAQNGSTIRISVSSSGIQANNTSSRPSISFDGRYIVYESDASNLINGDTNNSYDIFMYDTQTEITTRVSLTSNNAQGNRNSYSPMISADGRYVLFYSEATNLVSGDTNGYADVFVRDLVNETTTRVSVATDGTQANRESLSSFISPDGHYVVFSSAASNLTSGDTGWLWDVFVRDIQTNTTSRVSIDLNGTQGNNNSYGTSISEDGRYVLFRSAATNLVNGDNNGVDDVFLHDLQTGTTILISYSNGLLGNGASYGGVITADGKRVVFSSYANNLVDGDTNNTEDVYIYDRQTTNIERISLSTNGTQGNQRSYSPVISSDGKYVAFTSIATNLVENDTNGMQDIFRREGEDSTLPNIRVVSKTADTNDGVCDSDCSLREAISQAVSGDTIIFDPSLAGGGIGLSSQLLIAKDLTIDGSRLNPPLFLTGGYMTRIMEIHYPAKVTISGLILQNGHATSGDGGAVYNTGEFTAIDSSFIDNSAGNGGAIWGGTIKVINSTFSGNVAINGGAITGVFLDIRNSTFHRNEANQDGGAISVYGDGTSTIANSTIFQNQAGDSGGGIFMTGYPLVSILNSTFAENTAVNGHEFALGQTYQVTFANTIFVCSAPGDDCYVPAGNTIINTNSILGIGTLHDYGLAGLADNGGSTQTMAVLPDSPLIDAGDDATCTNAPVNNLDQRGVARPQGSHCDIGAFELVPPLIVTKTSDTNDGICDSDCSLREAIGAAMPGDTITFDPSLAGETITLSSPLNIFSDSHLMIDGSGLNPPLVLSGENASQIMNINGSPTITILGLAFTKGVSTNGGAIAVKGLTQLTLENCAFYQNQASSYGGAIAALSNNTLNIINSSFDQNQAGTSGGAIHMSGLVSSTIVNSTFLDNHTNGNGGAIFGANIKLIDSSLSGNSAGGMGGAIYSLGPDTRLQNTSINGNQASLGGGGVAFAGNSSGTIVNSTLAQNEANDRGGAILVAGGYAIVDVLNSTFAGNTAPEGSEVRVLGFGTFTLSNTILACVPGNNACVYLGLGHMDMSNSIIETGRLASFGLAELADNGGPTQTMAVLPGSPLIDTGDDTICANSLVNNLDQRGMARPQGSHCDIGAYEHEPRDSTVQVVIKNSEKGSYVLSPNQSLRKSYPGLSSGPVKIINADNLPIMAAERVIYKVNGVDTSFSEMMALPESQLDTVYWLPWYNNKTLNSQLRIANPSATEQASVEVTIGGTPASGSPFTLDPGASIRKTFTGIDRGPVKIESTIPVVAAERVIYRVNGMDSSFSEMMAMPEGQLDTVYWLPWYNNKTLNTQLRIANPSETEQASVDITIGGTPVPGSPFTIDAGQSLRKTFTGIDKGPVKIESNIPIVVAERVIYKVNGVDTSFSEMMALPAKQLDKAYWLPWYNNKTLNTQLRIANVSDEEATVYITIDGVPVLGSPFALASGASIRKSFAGIDKGPVQIRSNVPIVVSERVIYEVNRVDTSFSEMMALPYSQLDTTYWLPWYNNVELNTQLRFGVP